MVRTAIRVELEHAAQRQPASGRGRREPGNHGSWSQRAFCRLADAVSGRFRAIFLAIAIVVPIALAPGTTKLKVDSSNEAFFVEDAESLELNARFKELFGNEEFVFVLVEPADAGADGQSGTIFTKEAIELVRRLDRELLRDLPFADDVVSLASVEYTALQGDSLLVGKLFPDDGPLDDEVVRGVAERVASKRIYRDRIVSAQGDATGIFVSLGAVPKAVHACRDPMDKNAGVLSDVTRARPVFKADLRAHDAEAADGAPACPEGQALATIEDPRKLIAPALGSILARHRVPGLSVKAVGVPVLDYEIDRITGDELGKFGLWSLAAAALLLLALFRSMAAVAGPVLVGLATLMMILGGMGFLGISLTLSSVLIPALIVVISVSYSVHIVGRFSVLFAAFGDRTRAVRGALTDAGPPCFLAALTTCLGFASFVTVSIRPIREVGLVCAVGSLLAFAWVVITIPAMLSYGRNRDVTSERGILSVDTGDGKMGHESFFAAWAAFVSRRRVPVAVVSVLAVASLLWGARSVRVDTDFLQLLGDNAQVVKDTAYVTNKLGGFYSYEILVELPKPGDALEPSVLRGVETVVDAVSQMESTRVVLSAVDLLKDIRSSIMGRDAGEPDGGYRLGDTRHEHAQHLLVYDMAGGGDIGSWMDFERQRLRISVQADRMSTSVGASFVEIRRLAKEVLPKGTAVSIVGDGPMMLKVASLVSQGQITSVGIAILVIGAMLMWVLRSFVAGLLAMTPNVVAVVAVLGTMGLTGTPLDMVTMVISAVILGIAVDDTIHYIVHFRNEFRETKSYEDANHATFMRVGKVIAGTTVVLTAGFGIIALSSVQSLIHFGVFSCVGVVAALLADLFVTPVLFLLLKPLGPEHRIASAEAS